MLPRSDFYKQRRKVMNVEPHVFTTGRACIYDREKAYFIFNGYPESSGSHPKEAIAYWGRRPGNCLSGLGRVRAVASRYCLVASASRKRSEYLVKYSAAALRRAWLRVLAGLRIDAQWPALTFRFSFLDNHVIFF
jgi:hypothetical protein